MLGGSYEQVVSQQAPYMNGFSMNMVNGLSATFTTNVIVSNVDISHIISNTGLAYGVSAWYETHMRVVGKKGLSISHVHAGAELAPSKAFRRDSYPNLKPEGCAFRVYDDVIYKAVIDYNDNVGRNENLMISCISGHTGCLQAPGLLTNVGEVSKCADPELADTAKYQAERRKELTVVAPVILCLFRSTKTHEPLRLWSMLRVLLFVIQIPSRCDILHQLSELNALSALSLSAILRSNSWLSMQIASLSVTLWIALTMLGTVIAQRCSQKNYHSDDAVYFCVEGELSLCLLRCSYVSVLLFAALFSAIVFGFRKTLLRRRFRHCAHYETNTAKSMSMSTHSETRCSICFDSAQSDEHRFVALRHCRHRFHQKCIEQWFDRKLQCPLCLHRYGDGDDVTVAPIARGVSVSSGSVNNFSFFLD